MKKLSNFSSKNTNSPRDCSSLLQVTARSQGERKPTAASERSRLHRGTSGVLESGREEHRYMVTCTSLLSNRTIARVYKCISFVNNIRIFIFWGEHIYSGCGQRVWHGRSFIIQLYTRLMIT